MPITLQNNTCVDAQFLVRKGDLFIASVATAVGGSVTIPNENVYTVKAQATIDGNVYTSAPVTINGAAGFLVEVKQDPVQQSFVFEMVEIPALHPNQLEFEKTCKPDVIFTIHKDGKPQQAVLLSGATQRTALTLSDIYTIIAIANGITTDPFATTDQDASISVVYDQASGRAGDITLISNELTGDENDAWSEATLRTDNLLQLTMQVQQMSNWCWAATSSSINDFYFGSTDLDNTQDKLVGKAFQGSCLIAPRSQACNRPNTISAGLILTKRYSATVDGSMVMSAIQPAIDAQQPIAVAIVSSNGGIGHMLALIGYDQSANIIVKDPAIGDAARVVALAGFPGNLYTNYNWTRSSTTHA